MNFAFWCGRKVAQPRLAQRDTEGQRKPADPDAVPRQIEALRTQRLRPLRDAVLEASGHDKPKGAVGTANGDQQNGNRKAETRRTAHPRVIAAGRPTRQRVWLCVNFKLDDPRASFETAALRPPQDEVLS